MRISEWVKSVRSFAFGVRCEEWAISAPIWDVIYIDQETPSIPEYRKNPRQKSGEEIVLRFGAAYGAIIISWNRARIYGLNEDGHNRDFRRTETWG